MKFMFALVSGHFELQWKREYLTHLREFHKKTGNNKQSVKVGDWYSYTVINQECNGKWLLLKNRPITKLYPLEITAAKEETTEKPEHEPMNQLRKRRKRKDRNKLELRRRLRLDSSRWAPPPPPPPPTGWINGRACLSVTSLPFYYCLLFSDNFGTLNVNHAPMAETSKSMIEITPKKYVRVDKYCCFLCGSNLPDAKNKQFTCPAVIRYS